MLRPELPAWHQQARYLLVNADAAVRDFVAAHGYRELTTIRTFRWAPPGEPHRTRPIRPVGEVERQDLLDRFRQRFDLRTHTEKFPGITEPPDSVTWAGQFAREEQLTPVVRRGLAACAEPGELIYFADPYHYGTAAEPRRVGGPGQPEWLEPVVADGDYAINVPHDLRFGTFAHPWEDSLCVWGAGLLAHVEAELDAVLPRLRTGGKPR